MNLLLLLLIHIVTSTIISKTLPPLELEIINYPIQIYNISNERDFEYTFQPSQNGKIQIIPQYPEEGTREHCRFLSWEPEMELISSHPSAWENTYGPLFYCEVYVPSQRLLYSLSFDLVLTVYRYHNNDSLHKQSFIQLQGKNTRYTQLRQYMILSSDQKYLYVFTPMNYNMIWRVHTKDVLGRVYFFVEYRQSQVIDEFNLQKPILKTVSHNDYIYAVLNSSGLVVFKIDNKGILQLKTIISTIQQKPIFPVSIGVNNRKNLLFVLDAMQNIYVFNISTTIQLYDTITFSHPQNMHLEVFENRIYFSFYENQFAISEILYNHVKKIAILIRYYTSDQYISNFQASNEILLMLSGRNMQIYSSNIDPRIIKKQHNSNSQIVKGQKILDLQDGYYLLIGKNTYTVYKLRFKLPTLKCNRDSQPLFLNITYSGISKTCKKYYNSQVPFYVACNFTQSLKLQLPQFKHQSISKIVLFIVIISIFMLIMISGFWLKKWRQSKIKIIQMLRNKIKQSMNNNSAKDNNQFQIQINEQFQMDQKQNQQQFFQSTQNDFTTKSHTKSEQV